MIDARGKSPLSAAAREFPLLPRSNSRDVEPESVVDSEPAATGPRGAFRPDARLRRVAADILRSVQSRLPGRVRDLKVRVEDDQFVISGVSTSYYVKQVAQHVAMNALEAVMLGRLVNEIEVRSLR
jgi:hypothetical protein